MLEIKAFASGSKGNAYLLDDGAGHKLLLECGIPFSKLLEALNFNLIQLSGCLLTHEHQDHSKAVKELLKHGVGVYCSKGTAEALGITDHWNVKIVQPKQARRLQDGNWNILPLKAEHDAAEPLMFLITDRETTFEVLFATDTYFIRNKMPKTLTHLMIECNYSMDHLNKNISRGTVQASRKYRILHSHMNLNTLKEFIQANNFSALQAIYLLHLSDANAEEDRMIKEIEELTGVPVTAF